MKVAVVLPVRDAESTILRAARSILEGSHGDLELICVDDGSVDDTPQLLAALARSDPRVLVLRQPPRGIVEALQRGWRSTDAELIARMDADDWSHPDRLRAQLALLRERPELGLVGAGVRIRGEARSPGLERYAAWVNGLCEPEAIRRERFVDSPIPHPTWLLRRTWLERSGGYRDDALGPEDHDLLLRLFELGLEAAKVPRVLVDWWDRPERLTRTDPRCSFEAIAALKARYLLRGPLAEKRPALLQGLGRQGKALLRALVALGHPPMGLLDENPRRIGKTIHEVPVLPVSAAASPELSAAFVLVAVSSADGRARAAAELSASGRRAERDYLFVA